MTYTSNKSSSFVSQYVVRREWKGRLLHIPSNTTWMSNTIGKKESNFMWSLKCRIGILLVIKHATQEWEKKGFFFPLPYPRTQNQRTGNVLPILWEHKGMYLFPLWNCIQDLQVRTESFIVAFVFWAQQDLRDLGGRASPSLLSSDLGRSHVSLLEVSAGCCLRNKQ